MPYKSSNQRLCKQRWTSSTAATTVFPTATTSCPLQWLWHSSHSSNIVDVLSDYWTRPRPSSTTLATPSQTLLSISRCSIGLQRTRLHNSTELFTKAKADVTEFTTSWDAEKTDLVEAEKNLSASVASQAASKDSCGQVASEHEARVKGFAEEMQRRCSNRRREEMTCSSASETSTHFAGSEVVTLVRRVAKEEHSVSLSHLASRFPQS